VGREAAEADVDDCMELAAADVGRGGEGAAVGEAATGGATGAAAGAAGGAVVGRAGTGAAIGAAAGATRGFLRGLFRSREPDAAFRGYVNRCLHERGYDPVGWR
jgi:outer membrane lipoprotein SlyB